MASRPEIKQQGRLLRIMPPAPLVENDLVLRRLVVTEAIGRPFVIEAEVAAPRGDLKPKDLLGKTLTCIVAAPDQPEREFHGMVRAFGRVGGEERDLTLYRLEAVPLLWNLSRTRDCRIFQDKTVQDILGALTGEASVAPQRFGTLPTAPRPYCVQYNESDFEFLHRLLDEIGAGYFFEHSERDHTLVFTGANADFPPVPGSPLVVRATGDRPDSITNWRMLGSLQPGKHVAHDYDMLNPGSPLQLNAPTRLETPNATDWEVFRWAAGQSVQPDAQAAELTMEQDEAQADIAQGDSQTPALFAGGRVKVAEGLDGTEASWLITEIRHEATDETHLVAGATATYANSFVAIPADRAWRNPAPRLRPVMPALQCALVTGPSGEEIHCDRYGRVKVHFLWDRAGKKDETSSCYVRVTQPWAGKWGGAWFLPRIGDEVLVGFLEGDPDRPVVLGSLHNQGAMPHYALPGNMTRSGITTRSSKGGGQDNANMLRFEDLKDSEELYLQAERDQNVLVKRQLSTTIGGDEIRKVEGSHSGQSTGHRTTTIKGDETLTVTQGNRETTISQGNDTYTLSLGNLAQSINTGNMKTEVKLGNYDLTLTPGNIGMKTAAGAVTIEALQSITLKCGPTEVKIDPMGVTIKGMMIKLDASMMLEMKGALMAKHESSLMTTVKGSIIMIG
jgi:type VI secretion system secreted protein VgrG